MRDSIAQFMWGFQSHFRSALERSARGLFEQIGFGLGARAFLVGFTDDDQRRFPVCFEPEEDPLGVVDLSGVVARGRHLYDMSKESKSFFSSSRHHELIHRRLRDRFRAEALRETLEDSDAGADMVFFVGSSALVDGIYEVHPVVAVPRARWSAKPALIRERVDRYSIAQSLQHALVLEILSAATQDLGRGTPPEDFSAGWSDRSELIRRAARRFVQSVSLLSGYELPSELAVSLDQISAQPYEGRSGSGGLLLASGLNAPVEMVLEFVAPVCLSETRSLRKSLEMAGPDHHLLCDGEKVIGLARLSARYDPAEESAFTFNIVARGAWELSHHGQPLLRVTDTRATLPKPRLDAANFKSVATRVFAEVGDVEAEVLWSLTLQASAASHGTMLVVHRHASEEAARLVPQAQQVRPQVLDPQVLAAVTNIDGAVLVDTSGACHAVGVILDGHATGIGDPSRGARYNSGVRYQEATAGDSMVIIVSEDGMINLLPDLRRQVSRSAVDEVVAQVENAVSEDPDYEVFFRYWRHLEALAFYLDEHQCARANDARERLEAHRNATGMIQVGWTRMAPDPNMDGSYFVEE